MPVVEINSKRLVNLVGPSRTKNAIIDALPYLGLDIESIEGDIIKVEYSPNRPDYSTDYGIVEGLRGILGVKTGAQKITIKKGSYVIHASDKLARIRPIIMGIVARRVNLDEHDLQQLISMQEDLHDGLGRKRRIASIGIHDMSSIAFPLEYNIASSDSKITPLGSQGHLTLKGVLETSDIDRKYVALVENLTHLPLLVDANKKTISFPPITNSEHTKLGVSTRQIFVEVTGTDVDVVEDTLSVIVAMLASMGCELFNVKIIGGPVIELEPFAMKLDPSLVHETLGLDMSVSQIIKNLRRSRIDARKFGTRIICNVPRHRFDILGEMDLVEEVALGYGINNIIPLLASQESAGKASAKSIIHDSVSECMIGLAYTEILNSSLVDESSIKNLRKDKNKKMLFVMESKNQHTVLRDSLIPGLLNTLSCNVHELYPQHLFEIGTVFAHGQPIEERDMIGAVMAHKDASYTQAKSTAAAVILRCFGSKITTIASTHCALEGGHTADILLAGTRIGIIGDVSAATLDALRVRQRVAVFELDLDALAKLNSSIKN